MYEYGRYWRVVLVALVLTVACGLLRHRAKPDAHTVKPDSCAKLDVLQVEFPVPKLETQVELQGSKIDGTGMKLERYSSVAVPAWEREHPGREWPDTVDELNKYIGACDSLDSWGHPIKLLCGSRVPGGGCTLVSAGADGQFDTSDDLAPF